MAHNASLLVKTLVVVVMITFIFVAPFTKVEASFNLQASHDLLFFDPIEELDQFDHQLFPGVVPRTFLGSVWLSIAYPIRWLLEEVLVVSCSKIVYLYLARLLLGLIGLSALFSFANALSGHLGSTTSVFLLLVYAVQFHPLYYISRPLPNVFALTVVTYMYTNLLLGNYSRVLLQCCVATLIYRAEVVLVAAPVALFLLFSGKMSFFRIAGLTILFALLSLALTVLFDSYMWGRWVWPEGEVLYFNTVLNKSSEWGTSPMWWYAGVAIPKVLSFTALLLPFGAYQLYRDHPSLWLSLSLPTITLLALYSLLPHKELRFVFYAFPVLNTFVAYSMSLLWKRSASPQGKLSGFFSTIRRLLPIALLLATVATTIVFAYVSSLNYPGGVAFTQFHQRYQHVENISVHIDVLPAMTGVSRFGELNERWNYSKTEELSDAELSQYTHLISAREFVPGFRLVESIDGYGGIQRKPFPPSVRLTPQVFIHERSSSPSPSPSPSTSSPTTSSPSPSPPAKGDL
eukprot:TRINITY_DN10423_c0_g1_i1.p1 TRINITY_DN10423_c0_g1~~TRINITY_DN10423_c0_g1_i1.p1  ORF type:complete len:533 (+),score=72.24 TRINITY_DN10423_c0_g1_i1:54-1601(+)